MKNKWKLHGDYSYLEGKCPSCNKGKFVFVDSIYQGIEVNCESEGIVHIPHMWHIRRSCNNPLCKWSNIKR